MVPPRWVRRVVLGPVVPVLTVLLLTSLPVTAIAAAFASRWLPGRWRPLRLLWFLLVFLVVESLTLIGLFGLWLLTGCGRRVRWPRWQEAHYTLMCWYLRSLIRSAERRFHVRVDADLDDARLPSAGERVVAAAAKGEGYIGPEPAAAAGPDADRPPLIVLSRHAGPGDSFLLVHALLELRYRPRIVLRGALRWAPAIDVALHRVPSCFLESGAAPGTGTRAITAMASQLGPRDALVIFPEGRNFTPERRLHSITRLDELGDHHAAEDARELRHVLAPRPGGTLAALDVAPDADVVFVAHTGLEDLSGIVDLWRGLPMDTAVEVKVWRVPAAEVPRARAAREAWLAWWWRRIDAWLVERHGEQAVPDAVVEAVSDARPEPDTDVGRGDAGPARRE